MCLEVLKLFSSSTHLAKPCRGLFPNINLPRVSVKGLKSIHVRLKSLVQAARAHSFVKHGLQKAFDLPPTNAYQEDHQTTHSDSLCVIKKYSNITGQKLVNKRVKKSKDSE
jgi:hypothetical protein